MHYTNLLFLFAVCCIGYLAAKQRMFWGMRRKIETTQSPFSRAIGELVGIAGGIYLALELLTSFLSINLPEKVSAYGLSLDPLAVLSIAVALVQPYAVSAQNLFKKWMG